jgi:hypothetical protein
MKKRVGKAMDYIKDNPEEGIISGADQAASDKQHNTAFSGKGAPGAQSQGPMRSGGRTQAPVEPPQDAQQAEYLTVAARSAVVRKTTYLLVGLFILSVVCLWLMVKKTTPRRVAAAGGDQTQIELAISRLTGVSSEMFHRMDQIVRKFYEFSDVQQVRVNDLVKNPFKHETFLGDLRTGQRKNPDSDATVRQLTQDMQLLSIIQSDQGNCCMIDDRILYVGDSIRGFKVCEIGDNAVKLESQESEIVLKLSE